MDHKQKILLILVTGIILLWIVWVLVFNNSIIPSEKDKNISNDKINTSIIEPSEKVVIYNETLTYKFEPTSKPHFEVGETYHYRVRFYSSPTRSEEMERTSIQLSPMDVFIHVEKIERINKTECYLLRRDKSNDTIEIITQNKKTGKRDISYITNEYEEKYYCINRENGSAVRPIFSNGKNEEEKNHKGNVKFIPKNEPKIFKFPFMPYFKFFEEWMLCLKENTKWVYEAKGRHNDKEYGGDIEGKSEMKVTGIEKINGRECFVYEETRYTQTTSTTNVWKTNQKWVYWIDAKKRIMVKQKLIEDGVTIFEAELVS